MNKKYYFIIVIIIVFIAGFLIIKNFLMSNERGSTAELLIDVKSQKIKKRIENKKLDIQLQQVINLEKIEIYKPVKIKVDTFGDIYVLDLGTPNIIKFSKEGNIVSKFGKGKGKGPGELINPTDFSIDEKGNIWIIDPAQGQVLVFDKRGDILSNFKVIIPSYRISTLNSTKEVKDSFNYVLVSLNNDKLFHIYQSNKAINSFGNMITNQEKYSIMLSGKLATDNNNNIYFTADRGSLLVSFNSKGNLRFAIKTIENSEPLPKIKIENNILRLPNTFTSLDISIKNDKIFILNRFGLEKLKKNVIDIYNSKNGQYIFSIIIPERIYSCDLKDNNIYAINDTSLLIYKIKGNL